jgi:hypothetical protein
LLAPAFRPALEFFVARMLMGYLRLLYPIITIGEKRNLGVPLNGRVRIVLLWRVASRLTGEWIRNYDSQDVSLEDREADAPITI